ncbi:DUF3419 family protein [bacterium]|nr:DUF3419 family protein [bacterium]
MNTTIQRPTLEVADAPILPDPLRDRLFWRVFSNLPVFTILFEDTDVEARFFQVDEASRVLSVAAAGCGIASLLASRPQHIDAVDGNAHHLALTALKVEAARRLSSHEELYELFGYGVHSNPDRVLKELTASLPAWIQAHWARHRATFRRGLYRGSLSTRLFGGMRSIAGLDDAWMSRVIALPTAERVAEVEQVYQRLLKNPFFAVAARSPLLMLATGINFRQRDRNLSGTGTMDMAAVCQDTGRRVAATDVETNWIFWHVMAGQFNHAHPEARPPYLRQANHARSLGAPTTTAYHHRSFLEVMAGAEERIWTHYNFSDAMDWLSEDLQRRTLAEVVRTSRPGALFINRSVEDTCMISRLGLEDSFKRLPFESDEATAMERAGLYRRVDLYRVVR